MKQRRRWYLGTLGNEIHMLCSPILWEHVPGLLILQLLTSLKNGPLFLYVFLSEQVLGRGSILTLTIAMLIFLPIWLFVSGFGIKIHRLKISWAYPFIVLLLPIMSAFFQLYGVWTLRVRSWGGPRAQSENKTKTQQQAPPTNDAPAQGAVPSFSGTHISIQDPSRPTSQSAGLAARPPVQTRPFQSVVIAMDAVNAAKKIKQVSQERPRLMIEIPEDPPIIQKKWSEIQIRNPLQNV
jgi:hypothetical protein